MVATPTLLNAERQVQRLPPAIVAALILLQQVLQAKLRRTIPCHFWRRTCFWCFGVLAATRRAQSAENLSGRLSSYWQYYRDIGAS
eukprot:g22599.t1